MPRISSSPPFLVLPGHGILAEEGLVRRERRNTAGSSIPWTGRPISPTLPVFSVSIGLENRGDPVLGVVFDPVREEMFGPPRGAGPIGGRPIRVSGVSDLDRSLLATGFPYDIRRAASTTSINSRIYACGPRPSGGAARPRWTCVTWPAAGSTGSGS